LAFTFGMAIPPYSMNHVNIGAIQDAAPIAQS